MSRTNPLTPEVLRDNLQRGDEVIVLWHCTYPRIPSRTLHTIQDIKCGRTKCKFRGGELAGYTLDFTQNHFRYTSDAWYEIVSIWRDGKKIA